MFSFDEFLELGAKHPSETKVLPKAEDPACIMYTSGTTGGALTVKVLMLQGWNFRSTWSTCGMKVEFGWVGGMFFGESLVHTSNTCGYYLLGYIKCGLRDTTKMELSQK